jgi:hypothetical protein
MSDVVDDLDILDLAAGTGDEPDLSNAPEYKQVEKERLVTFLGALIPEARRLGIDVIRPWFRALVGNRTRLSELEGTVSVSVFADDPEPDAIGRLSGILRGLRATNAVAGVLGAGARGRRSGVVRAARNAKRDAKVRALWDAAPVFSTLIARGRYVVRTMREKGWPRDEIPEPRAVVRITTRK